MSYHIISIDTTKCDITCAQGQLVVSTNEGINQIPLEDVASIVITSFHCNISSTLLTEAAKLRISLILCELYKPVSILLPINRGTDTCLLRNITRITPQLKRRLWAKTIDAKCINQVSVAQQWNPEHPLLSEMHRIAVSQKETKEAEVARIFWTIFSDTYTQGEFKRDRFDENFNALFNYGYAILLSCVLRYLLALGIDPTFGIFHAERPHATPLAYDLMEPFRAIFDAAIAEWITIQRKKGIHDSDITSISREYKKHITQVLLNSVSYQNKQCNVKQAIEGVIRTFRASILTLQSGPYEPWKI